MEERSANSRAVGKVPWGWLGLVIVAAASVRLIVGGMTSIIGADGPTFLRLAGQFASGDLSAALRHDYHPLYPALIALVSPAFDDPELAGQAVSFLFGVLTPLPLFFLARRSLGAGPALAGGILLAIHPVASRLSVDLKSDSLYTFLFVLAAWLAWEGIDRRKAGPLFLAGFTSGLAYLVRPEGLGITLVACAFLLPIAGIGRGRKLALVGMILLGAVVTAAPYAAVISIQDGRPQITRKKGLSQLLGAASPRRDRDGAALASAAAGPSETVHSDSVPPSPSVLLGSFVPMGEGKSAASRLRKGDLGTPARLGLSLVEVLVELAETLHPVLCFFFILGIVCTRVIPRQRGQEVFLGCLLLAYCAVLLLLAFSVSYLSRRHVFPLAIISIPWSAAGVWESVRWLSPRLGRWSLTAPFSPIPRSTAVFLGTIAVVLSAQTFYPSRLDQLFQREAGIWIRSVSAGDADYVLTNLEKVAYYAGATWVPIARDYPTSISIARHFRTRYAAFYREKVSRDTPGFFEAIRDEDLVLRASFTHWEGNPWFGERKAYHLDIFEILYPDPSGDPPQDR